MEYLKDNELPNLSLQLYTKSNLSFGILDLSNGFDMINIGLITCSNEFYNELKLFYGVRFNIRFRIDFFANYDCFYSYYHEKKSIIMFSAFNPNHSNFNRLFFNDKIIKQHDEIINVFNDFSDKYNKFFKRYEQGFNLCITLK